MGTLKDSLKELLKDILKSILKSLLYRLYRAIPHGAVPLINRFPRISKVAGTAPHAWIGRLTWVG